MNAKKLLWGLPVAGAVVAGFGIDRHLAAEVKQDLKPAVNLPMTRVVLFNSGVGYFSRSGEVEGEARVDLAFHDPDVNDLLKSMVLEDFGNGHIAAVSYDSREPISRTLSSFAINLNGNPTLADILSQARGERVEVTMQPTAANQPGKLNGAIVGIERQVKDNAPVEILNLWCAEGLRAVKLSEVQQLRFANPLIESEFRRALEVLALNHDSQKKSVSLHFSGEGKRKVQVGYVIEAPIWKTSYRLMLDANGKQKPYLQGWAVVENPTDEDWLGVKMSLISGRPISFKMDLYDPLYVPRPTVEPELFASLRPPTYDGGFGRLPKEMNKVSIPPRKQDDAGRNQDDAVDKISKAIKEDFVLSGLNSAERPAPDSTIMGGGGRGRVDEKRLRAIAENWGSLPASERARLMVEISASLPAKYQPMINEYFQSLDRNPGGGKKPDLRFIANYDVAGLGTRLETNPHAGVVPPITPANAYGVWNANAGRSRIDPAAIGSAATGASLGDFFQYAIDQPVSLSRQKSALLPILGKDVEGTRVSIYNPAVQAKHPLLGLRIKNTTGSHLAQGPVTVFEGHTYAGDTRVLDVQPNEERLVSYAIDLGTEVDPQLGEGTTKITSVKAVKGIVSTVTKVREATKYRINNRSPQDRQLILEHPNRTNQQFKLVETAKPTEDTKDVYRFAVPVKAGAEATFVVTEERDLGTSVALSNSSDDQMKYFLSLNEAPAALKAKLTEALKLKGAWDSQKQDLAHVGLDLARLNLDQDRIRKNLANTPKEAEVYQVYLKKLSDQEKEIDTLTARQKKLMTDEFAAKNAFEDYLANLSD